MIPESTNFQTANAALAKQPWHIFVISGFAPIYSFGKTGITDQYPWISRMDALSQAAQDLQGSSTLSDLAIEVLDKNGALTAAFPSFTFEGAKATILTGFPGLTYPSDYLTVATMLIDRVESSADNTAYTFHLRDYSLKLSNLIYTTGDDGWPTSSDHPKTLIGNPMDILLDVLANQIPLDPAQINITAIADYKATLFAGTKLKFNVTNAPSAKDFLDRELFKALGGYGFQNYAGQFTPHFFIPTAAPSAAMTLTDHNLAELPTPGEADLVDALTYRLDYDGSSAGGGFRSEFTEVYGKAVNTYGLQGLQTIEARGALSALGGWGYGRLLANALFLRYGGTVRADGSLGGKTLVLNAKAFWTAVILEPGDFVYLTHPLIPNRLAGTMGLIDELFEVLEVKKNFEEGTVELKLLDVNWLNGLGAYQIAPDSTPTWPNASQQQRAQYQFVSSAATGKYGTGDSGHKIF